MSSQLPPRPRLDHLKKQAKDLLKAHRAGEPQASNRLKARLPRLAQAAPQASGQTTCSLQEAQHVIAREYGYATWAALVAAVESQRENSAPSQSDLGAQWQEAIENGDAQHVRQLLDRDPKLIRQRLIQYRDDGTWFVLNPLIAACDQNCLPVARVLVEEGADVNERNPDGGGLPLGPDISPELADYLLDHGAQINATGYGESVPLICAAYCGNVALVTHLLKRGAAVDQTNPREGGTALHYAAFCRPQLQGFESDEDFDPQPFRTIVQALINAGADVNARCGDNVETDAGPLTLHGETPLHFAVASRDEGLVRLLLEGGADPGLSNTLGQTPHDWAAEYAAGDAIARALTQKA